jgi:folate-binding protein YgfZ
VHAVFPDLLESDHTACDHKLTTRSPEVGSTFCDGGELAGSGLELPPGRLPSWPDPRLPALGHRLVLPTGQDPLPLLPAGCRSCHPATFTSLRYRLGVAEGAAEVPTGKALPLEYNLDYLHGVNFHKGCYIGQELTARTHHTGVIRKRILPLTIEPADDHGN